MQKRPKGWETARDDPNHIGELLVTIDGKQYAAQDIVSCEIERNLLENTAEVGNATAAVLTLEISQGETIPKRAKVVVQYRLMLDDARTDYIPKGTYWINTREKDGRYLKLTCYDAMLMAQQDYLGDVTADRRGDRHAHPDWHRGQPPGKHAGGPDHAGGAGTDCSSQRRQLVHNPGGQVAAGAFCGHRRRTACRKRCAGLRGRAGHYRGTGGAQ